MKTATVRKLRYHFKKLEAWLNSGEEIEITRRSEPIALLSPPKRKLVHPDYEARAKEIWGDRFFSDAEVEEMRAFETGEP
jgi:antitoxin (DNA-binding transcriptional repressor) of toxin-antitoxin stability system